MIYFIYSYVYFFSLSLCTYIIYIIDLDLYYQTWAVCISHLSCFEMNKCERTYISTGADTQNTREKPTACMQWPCQFVCERMKGCPHRSGSEPYVGNTLLTIISVWPHQSQVFLCVRGGKATAVFFIKAQMLLFLQPCIFSSSAIT